MLKATKSWGESQSSDKEEDAAAPITGPAGGEGDHNGGTDREKKEKFRHRRRKMRRYWTDELHERFLHAVEQLGGCHGGFTTKRYLFQKFRIQSRSTSRMHHSSSNTPSADFVVVRGIWIPTPEYSSICMAADEAAPRSGQVAGRLPWRARGYRGNPPKAGHLLRRLLAVARTCEIRSVRATEEHDLHRRVTEETINPRYFLSLLSQNPKLLVLL
ncbi:hypothetical protein GW17_00010630 [Ensete ventricosum]|uniref:Uncharacterized protein n=1 Tax=Ensete ventricosum TaxID=4639 RepID=A0A426ZX64_ENSVE|nr:hypothetical protein B296_00036601 [Ensete ventricosum]RWW25058.1 hypothetical protein GW17_00010630 [Ensete ventricosum]RZS26302.1 hypothetical protein BHM03_00059628 [Ensete ventricosum]